MERSLLKAEINSGNGFSIPLRKKLYMLDGDTQHTSGVSHDERKATKCCCALLLFCGEGTGALAGALPGAGLLAAQHNTTLCRLFSQDHHTTVNTKGFNKFCV